MSIQGSVNQLLTYSALGAGGLYSSMSKDFDRRLDKKRSTISRAYERAKSDYERDKSDYERAKSDYERDKISFETVTDKALMDTYKKQEDKLKGIDHEDNIISLHEAERKLNPRPSPGSQRAVARSQALIGDILSSKQALEDRREQIKEASRTFNEGRTEAGGVGRF